jgi:predicted  nucleic acid-binding Zn-ribbon protein
VCAGPSARQDLNLLRINQTNTISSDEEIREIVATFVRDGVDAYGKNQISRAIDSFSRAMLFDPFQETARRYLIHINQQQRLTAKQRAELFLFTDLAAFLDDLNKKKEYLIRRCDELLDGALRDGGDRPRMEAAPAKIEDKFHFPVDGRDVWDDSRNPLEALNAAFMRMKRDLSAQLSYLQEKYEWLANKGWETVSVASTLNPDENFVPQPPYLLDGSGRSEIAVEAVAVPAVNPSIRPTGMPVGLHAPQEEIALLRDELRNLKKDLDDLHAYVQEKDAKIASLNDRVVEFSLKLAEQEMVLNEKARLTDALSEQYADLQARLELGQKIIQDKNSQIQSLQDGLASLQAEAAVHQKELSGMLVIKDEEVDELTEIVRIYQGKLEDAHHRLERRKVSIVDLESTVEEMRVALFEKETALNKTRGRMNRLEEQLNNAQWEPMMRHPDFQ